MKIFYIIYSASRNPSYFQNEIRVGFVRPHTSSGWGFAEYFTISLEEWANQGGE